MFPGTGSIFGHIPDSVAVVQYSTIQYNTTVRLVRKFQYKSRFTSVPVHSIKLQNLCIYKIQHTPKGRDLMYVPHRKKSFSIFPSSAGMSLTKLSVGGNNDVIYKLESLEVTSRLGTGNIEKLFLRCICIHLETAVRSAKLQTILLQTS